MRISMYRADHWLAFGLGGCIDMLRARLGEPIDFQHQIVATHVTNVAELTVLVQQVALRGIDSYGPREQTVINIDNWMLNGIEGGIRILHRRQAEIPEAPLNRKRLVVLREMIDALIAGL